MSRKKEYCLVLFIFIVYSIVKSGEQMLCNTRYTPLVFFLCFVFLSYDSLKKINIMTLHRYHSVKNIYSRFFLNELLPIAIYNIIFILIAVGSGLIALFTGAKVIPSIIVVLRFFVINYINLFLLALLQLSVRILVGKWGSIIASCVWIALSVIQGNITVKFVSPFILNTAFLKIKDMVQLRTFLGYIIFFLVLILIVILSLKKDRKV